MTFGLLKIVFLILLIFEICSFYALIYNKGDLGRNNYIFSIIANVNIIISLITFSALPSSYLITKILLILSAIISTVSLVMKFTYKNNYDISRYILIFSLISTFILLII